MKKIITESQIRFVIRNELKNYLVQEGLWDTIKQTTKDIGSQLKGSFEKAGKEIKRSWAPTPEWNELEKNLTFLEIDPQLFNQAFNEMLEKKNGKFVYAGDTTKLSNNLTNIKQIIDSKFASNPAITEVNARMAKKRQKKAKPNVVQQPQQSTQQPTQIQQLQNILNNVESSIKSSFGKSDQMANFYGFTILKNLIYKLAAPAVNSATLSTNQQNAINSIFDVLDKSFKNLNSTSIPSTTTT